ncbi:predicted protein [Nematostella vectensis]|uniref:Uncharacterized protein n=2 Tax=Nematostella vectensis TaxID=45351 RepID=A7SYB2_NEMVE|nr:predicted protein [Nematostella vectensis]|eukprot:XP_001623397.1 predicted protein [Nematostella vectensis]
MHIEALTKRNMQLEEQLKELSEANRKQSEAHAQSLAVLPLRMNQTMKAKDEKITELQAEVDRLKLEASEREMLMEHLQNKCKILDEVARHRDALESVLACLDIIQEPDYDADGENERETDLINGSIEKEGNDGRKEARDFRIDSGVDTEGPSGSSY